MYPGSQLARFCGLGATVAMKAMKATKATKATASVTKKKPAAAPQATSAPASARSKGPMLKEYETMESDLGTDRSSMTRSDKVALLDAKVRAYKERDGKGISFSQPEMRCLCNRWGDTGLLAAPQQVQEMWVDTLQKGRGENKEMAKRAMVFAWLKDEESELWFCELVQLIIFPDDVVITIYIYICIYIYIYIYIYLQEFGEKFFQLTERVGHQQSLKRKEKWITKKQLVDIHGSEEAQDIIIYTMICLLFNIYAIYHHAKQ